MITREQYKTTLQLGTLEQCAELLVLLDPQYANAAKLLVMQRNLARLRVLLETQRSSPKIEKAKPLSIVRVSASDPRLPKLEDEEALDSFDYPQHYPPVLQSLLIKASKQVRQKRALSNTLHAIMNDKAELEQTVREILRLSEDIDEAYRIKKNFDKNGDLPRHLLAASESVSNDMNSLDKEMKLCRSRISKLKAKLNNPAEVAANGHKLRKWRQELEEEQDQLTNLKQRYISLSRC